MKNKYKKRAFLAATKKTQGNKNIFNNLIISHMGGNENDRDK